MDYLNSCYETPSKKAANITLKHLHKTTIEMKRQKPQSDSCRSKLLTLSLIYLRASALFHQE